MHVWLSQDLLRFSNETQIKNNIAIDNEWSSIYSKVSFYCYDELATGKSTRLFDQAFFRSFYHILVKSEVIILFASFRSRTCTSNLRIRFNTFHVGCDILLQQTFLFGNVMFYDAFHPSTISTSTHHRNKIPAAALFYRVSKFFDVVDLMLIKPSFIFANNTVWKTKFNLMMDVNYDGTDFVGETDSSYKFSYDIISNIIVMILISCARNAIERLYFCFMISISHRFHLL